MLPPGTERCRVRLRFTNCCLLLDNITAKHGTAKAWCATVVRKMPTSLQTRLRSAFPWLSGTTYYGPGSNWRTRVVELPIPAQIPGTNAPRAEVAHKNSK
jgi:hypothetical protein